MAKENENNEKAEIYEVIFVCKKKKKEHLIGPVRVQSRLRDVAVAKAAIEAYKNKEFTDVDLTSIRVKVRGF